MFTDWTQTDPHYFYLRGVVWGLVAASMFWALLIPWLTKRFGKGSND